MYVLRKSYPIRSARSWPWRKVMNKHIVKAIWTQMMLS